MKIIDSIDCVCVRLQSAKTYTYIGSRTYLFESDTTKSFLNKLNLKFYLDSIYSEKTGYSVIQNQTVWFFWPWFFGLDFFPLGSLMLLSHFPCLKMP
jgi:hypothetical protein